MHNKLTVTSYAGQAALEQWATQMDDLNRACARPNPYLSADYLRCFSRHNEYGLESDTLRIYTVREGERLIGCLPLRLMQDRFGPLRRARLCFLVPFDIEQPGMLCAPDDEQRVAHALVHHICDDEPQVDMFELIGQRPEGALYQAMHEAANARFRVRDIDVQPFNEIPMRWVDLTSYFRALSSSWRSSVSRYARKLLAAGTPEVVIAQGPQACSAWFDAFLDLETRSWKHGTSAAIARDARRTQLFREVMAGRAGFAPSFVGILIDSVLIAATLNGSSSEAPAERRGMWNFEITFDADHADLSPGLLVLLLTMRGAILRQERFVNLLNGFSYYKQHWKAEPVIVKKVQLIRRRSLHNLRGTVGDLLRNLRPTPEQLPGKGAAQSQDQKNDEGQAAAPSGRPDRSSALALAARALAYEGPGIERLSRGQLGEILPFDTRPTK